MKNVLEQFQLHGKTALITGGGGVLGSAIAKALAEAGARVAVTGLRQESAEGSAKAIREGGGDAVGFAMNVMERQSVVACREIVQDEVGKIDILVNAVGGNKKEATASREQSFFDLTELALEDVMKLNFFNGVLLPCQIFGAEMAEQESGGVIINVSSMAADRPLTNVVAYSAAKAAVDNFTRWLAVHLAQEYGSKLRVNAIAPGFFETPQNRFLLVDEESGRLTDRGQAVIDHTPMGRFGEPEDLAGAAVWLASGAARFVTGIVLPVDGGFSAYAGL